MSTYKYELLNGGYYNVGASIPNGDNKRTAMTQAKRWMRKNGYTTVWLSVYSVLTGNHLQLILITI